MKARYQLCLPRESRHGRPSLMVNIRKIRDRRTFITFLLKERDLRSQKSINLRLSRVFTRGVSCAWSISREAVQSDKAIVLRSIRESPLVFNERPVGIADCFVSRQKLRSAESGWGDLRGIEAVTNTIVERVVLNQ